MRHSAFFYAAGSPSRWLRPIAIADNEFAALCRLHWEHRPRVCALSVASYARLPRRMPRRTVQPRPFER
jgi:hypothetical protein